MIPIIRVLVFDRKRNSFHCYEENPKLCSYIVRPVDMMVD